MTEADIDGVREVEVQSFPNPWSSKAFMSELRDNKYAYYLVACIDGRIIGYAGMWRLFSEAHITNIAVHPDFRRRGVGELLLFALMDQARRFGMTSMTLEVRPSNSAALSLYRKHGFVQRGVRRRYYSDNQEDALIMWKAPL
jgi:ribosomal-protein-alanine N-acetyltransferase